MSILDDVQMRAEYGDAEAAAELGARYLAGRGVDRDPAQARMWLLRAAAKGNADAQATLGWMYQTGVGVERDANEARQMYERAAEQGHAKAQSQLASLLAAEGDALRAGMLDVRAAAKGDAAAQSRVATRVGVTLGATTGVAVKLVLFAADLLAFVIPIVFVISILVFLFSDTPWSEDSPRAMVFSILYLVGWYALRGRHDPDIKRWRRRLTGQRAD